MPLTLHNVFFRFSVGHNPVRVVFGSPTHKFRYKFRGAQFGSLIPQYVARFYQRGFIPRLNVYHRVCIAMDGIFSQLVQIAIR